MKQDTVTLGLLSGTGPNAMSMDAFSKIQKKAEHEPLDVEFGTVRQFGHQHWSQRAERTVTIDQKNVCARITKIWLNHEHGMVMGTIEPFGPKRKLIKQSIDRCTADRLKFGIRGTSTPRGMEIVTFDLIGF